MNRCPKISAVSLAKPSWMLVAWYYALFIFPAANGSAAGVFQPPSWTPLPAENCPRNCDLLFGRLEDRTKGGGRVQNVQVQQRGEPKSGTTFMFEWGSGALAHSCVYLQAAYGRESCRIEGYIHNRTLIFEPRLSTKENSGPCSCDTVEKVTISLTAHRKHTLPVGPECSWQHGPGIAEKQRNICTPADGKATLQMNQTDLWKCVTEGDCPIVDNRLQFAVLRDPRATVVSSYFYSKRFELEDYGVQSVDEFVGVMLPTICQWVSLRFLLFEKMLKKQSSLFWYDDALTDPEHWHEQFLEFVGLNMPAHDVVNKAANTVADGGPILGFPSKGIDVHLGGADAKLSRSYQDEVTAETLSGMDDVLRAWLPPVLLEKLAVAPLV